MAIIIIIKLKTQKHPSVHITVEYKFKLTTIIIIKMTSEYCLIIILQQLQVVIQKA